MYFVMLLLSFVKEFEKWLDLVSSEFLRVFLDINPEHLLGLVTGDAHDDLRRPVALKHICGKTAAAAVRSHEIIEFLA